MTIEKVVCVDKIEILETNVVQVRTVSKIIEDGTEIASSYFRHVIKPGDDLSDEDPRVKLICGVIHTDEAIQAYNSTQSTLGEQHDNDR